MIEFPVLILRGRHPVYWKNEAAAQPGSRMRQTILDQTAHRPWPLPDWPWIMAQRWHQLLFAHWPVSVEALRAFIPAPLSIDTFQSEAWIGIVPFRMTGVRLRLTPSLPWLSSFPELNVRTYVTAEGKPGVWFFSLDAGNPLAVAVARRSFALPYFRARMSCEENGGWVRYRSQRTHTGAPDAVLHGRYRPNGQVFEPQPGTLEHFLTERYCLYAARSEGRVYRGDIHHQPWRLRMADAEFSLNSMAEAAGVILPTKPPLLHFALRQDIVAWAPRRIR